MAVPTGCWVEYVEYEEEKLTDKVGLMRGGSTPNEIKILQEEKSSAVQNICYLPYLNNK